MARHVTHSITMDVEEIAGFTVRRAEAQELPDLETFLVAVAEQEDGSGRALLFQNGLTSTLDPQDVRLGMDTHCVCDEWQGTAYGAVAACDLTGTVLTITYTPEAAE